MLVRDELVLQLRASDLGVNESYHCSRGTDEQCESDCYDAESESAMSNNELPQTV